MTAEFDPRSWAAVQLEVPPDAPLAEVCAALRQRLADDDFVPPWHVHQAAELLLRRGPDGRGNLARCQARLEEEQRLWTEIDDFAGEFFDLPPEKRRQRWQDLWAAGQFSPLLLARLCALQPGLTICVPEELGPDVTELIRHVCNLFVLRPGSRAALRHSLLRHMSKDVLRWKAAGRLFWKQAPEVARLVPDFSRCVAHNLAGLSEDVRQKKHVRGKARIRAAQLAGDTASSGASSRGSPAVAGIMVALILVLLRLSISNGPSSPKYTPPPPLTIPAEKIPWLGSEEQLQRWQRDMRRIRELETQKSKDLAEDLRRQEELRRLYERWYPNLPQTPPSIPSKSPDSPPP